MISQTLDQFLSGKEPEDLSDTGERWVTYQLDDLRPEWHWQGRCFDTGVDNFFADDEPDFPARIARVRRASKLCDVCPVFTECLRWALENREEHGVWAGTSRRTRLKIFGLLDEGVVTVEDVIEVYLNGQGDQFRPSAGRKEVSGGGASGDDCGVVVPAAASR